MKRESRERWQTGSLPVRSGLLRPSRLHLLRLVVDHHAVGDGTVNLALVGGDDGGSV